MTETKEMTWAAYQHAQKMGWTWLNESSVREIVEAALSASPAGVKPKPLEWVPVYYDGRDRVAKTPLGDYVISVDSDLAGGLHYLWVAGQSQDDEHHSVYKTMTAAKFAAFADYSARIMSAIEPAGVGVETLANEPVAWADFDGGRYRDPDLPRFVTSDRDAAEYWKRHGRTVVPLYTRAALKGDEQ